MQSVIPHRLVSDEPTGRELKGAAILQHEENRAALILQSRLALLRHLLVHGTGTMDDVRAVMTVPPGVSPTFFGGVPHALVAEEIITRDGYRPTKRPKAKDRPVAVWRLVNRQAAVEWIAENQPEEVA
jgi:hypothetical protein